MVIANIHRDFKCGVYALHFLFGLYEVNYHPEYIEEAARCKEESDIDHIGIMKAINALGVKYLDFGNSSFKELNEHLPAIINYQYIDADHYSVVLGKDAINYIIYNPANGEIELLPFYVLEKTWYSKKHGKGWFIQICS